jgi:hypothetical protein
VIVLILAATAPPPPRELRESLRAWLRFAIKAALGVGVRLAPVKVAIK